MAQVFPILGAGVGICWRRYALFLAQVGFLVGDLRRKTGSYALQWRRSHSFFLTCTKNLLHLRQHILTPAPRAILVPSTPASKNHRHLHQHIPRPTAQVCPILGAGMPYSWRRWGFWWGTCAAKRAPTHYSGAGPAPFSSPAPKTISTCARKPTHLHHVVGKVKRSKKNSDCAKNRLHPRQEPSKSHQHLRRNSLRPFSASFLPFLFLPPLPDSHLSRRPQ